MSDSFRKVAKGRATRIDKLGRITIADSWQVNRAGTPPERKAFELKY